MRILWRRTVQLCSFGRHYAQAFEICFPENAFCYVYISKFLFELECLVLDWTANGADLRGSIPVPIYLHEKAAIQKCYVSGFGRFWTVAA